jgi:hypothetical protein
MANLWFIRAVHELAAVLKGQPDHAPQADALHATLLPFCKTIVQQFISDRGIDGLRMDDGGLLVYGGHPSPAHAHLAPLKDGGLADAIRINALWYLAIDMTGKALKDARDPSGPHFERLAGRFRRSFAKTFWCDEHACLCTPAERAAAGRHGKLPDPDQLLVTMLPVSPLPRTKQRQIIARFRDRALGAVGLKVDHPEYGMVESPLHRAWLAQGVAVDDPREAAALAAPLEPLRDAAKKHAVHAFYRDGKPVPPPPHRADPLASAEVLGTLERFGHADAHGRHA